MDRSSMFDRAGWTRPALLVGTFAVVATIAVWLWTRPATHPSPDAGRAVADDFLEQLREGHPEQAWEATTAEFKSAQGKESFVRKVKPVKFLKEPLNFVSMQTVKVGEQPRAEYLYQTATGENVRIVLGREASVWKVDRWTPP